MLRRFFITAAALAVIAVFSACTSDQDTPLGSEFIGDLLGSRPGVVFEDTIPIASGDTVVSFYPLIENASTLELGRALDYERFMVLRADFSKPGSDTLRTVDQANLRILFANNLDSRDILGLFYNLGTEYSEGDTIASLDTLNAIVDPETGSPVRSMTLADPTYQLPTDLVQGWISGDSIHNGIGIVFTDLPADKVIEFSSSESGSGPSIQVFFTDGSSTTYRVTHDGTLVRPTTTTSNLIISDGFVRRIYFPVDLSQVDDSAAVHYATVTLNFVPGTVFGSNQSVQLYVPNSADPSDPGFRKGQLVSQVIMNSESGILELPVTNILLLILSGDQPDNGFVLRFLTEKTEVKQAEFYAGSDESLRPRVVITYSTPADFDD